MKLTLIQLKNLQNNDANLNHAVEMIDKAAVAGTDFIVLPEMFSCPYKTSKFPLYAQEEGGSNWKLLSDAQTSALSGETKIGMSPIISIPFLFAYSFML